MISENRLEELLLSLKEIADNSRWISQDLCWIGNNLEDIKDILERGNNKK